MGYQKKVKTISQSVKALPDEFVGIWMVVGENTRAEFKQNGYYFSIGIPQPYSIDLTGTKLNWGGTDYDRIDNNLGAGLVGVWLGPASDEEVNLRDNGTYSIHFRVTKEDYFGSFVFDSNTLTTSELRAIVTVSDDQITFDPPYGVSATATYEFNDAGDQLTITWENGSSAVYKK